VNTGQSKKDAEELRHEDAQSRAREEHALLMVKGVQEQAVTQRAYADEIALENGRLAREGVELARMINDKEASEQRLTDHIKNLDANVSLSLPLSRPIHVLILLSSAATCRSQFLSRPYPLIAAPTHAPSNSTHTYTQHVT
jgi:hypothetical protein